MDIEQVKKASVLNDELERVNAVLDCAEEPTVFFSKYGHFGSIARGVPKRFSQRFVDLLKEVKEEIELEIKNL